MTGQTLLDYMEIVNNELLLQSGEADVVRGLKALNVAQDVFESLLAKRPNAAGDSTGTITTSANTETTTFPTGLLRIDRLQLLDNATSRPKMDLSPIRKTGGHAFGQGWPYWNFSVGSSGQPVAYFTNARNIYWTPLPDATYTLRWYGLQSASDITAAGTFAYLDACAFPIATFAAKMLASGVDDDVLNLDALVGSTIQLAVDACDNFQRDGGVPLNYTREHDT